MKDKHAIKNMEYWKKKNNIPGIEALDMAGLTDGKAKSSAFQMATPGSSPNKGFLGNFMKGKGALGFLNPMGWLANKAGLNPGSRLGIGGNDPNATANAMATQQNMVNQQNMVPQPAMAAQPTQGVVPDPDPVTGAVPGITMKKSPLEAEIPKKSEDEQGRPISRMEDQPQEGETRTVAGQFLQKKDGVIFDVDLKVEYEDPSNIVEFKDIDLGESPMDDYGGVVQAPVDDDIIYLVEGNKIIGIQKTSPTKRIITGEVEGGVGGPLEMKSPTKIYKKAKEDRTKY